MARIATSASSDGRRRRSENSRAKIIEAMLSLVREGKIVPTAEEVAARADIGLRSVFRHFADMEMLRSEMVGQVAQTYMKWLTPYEGDDWRDQLKQLISRRASAYEETLPFKRAAEVRRLKSSAIGSEFDRINALMRSRLKSVLPEEFTSQPILFETLDLALSVDAWQRLREDQKLSVEDARTAVYLLVKAILWQANLQFDVETD
jgi:AcrR family transcriptional regulator